MTFRLRKSSFPVLLLLGMAASPALAQNADQIPSAPPAKIAFKTEPPFRVQMPMAKNPLDVYVPFTVPEPQLQNSPQLKELIRDGKLYLSLKDAIALALEDNLDLMIARYNLTIANTDVVRTRAGGSFRGVNTGIVQNTPGGGVGGLGTGAPGAGAGGTTSGAGGAGSGASGLVESTLGTGTAVPSLDPQINGTMGLEHLTTPLSNLQLNGVQTLQQNTSNVNLQYLQAFPTGTTFSGTFGNTRQTTNSIFTSLSPVLNSNVRFMIRQELLAGFGFGPNLRFLRIAKNNQKISDIAFKGQVIATITQIENIYWDLVSAYEQAHVNEESFAFAQQSLEIARKQLQLEAIPALDVTKAEAEVSKRDQDLTVARTNLQLQESLMTNAITTTLDDPVLEEIAVIPTDKMDVNTTAEMEPTQDLIARAMQARPELAESGIDLTNRQISRKAARNALLPTLELVASRAGTGLAGRNNPVFRGTPVVSAVPTDFAGAFQNAFNNSAPDYFVGLNLNIPIRNRIAKADQFRSEVEYRQAELRLEELKKQIRIEVRNAKYALEQSDARVKAATKARDLAGHMFEIMKKEQQLGAGSSLQTTSAQHDLALAELDLVNALAIYQKAKVELDRAIGQTLEHNGIQIKDALNGTVAPRNP